MGTVGFSPHPLILFQCAKRSSSWKFSSGSTNPSSLARICCSMNKGKSPQQQLNLSVLRFTLGIPGLDESYLPRYIGCAFGALLVLNHFVGSDSSYTTAAQLRTEALGLSLAAFSAIVPYLGKFLKGATASAQRSIPEGAEQIFIMSKDIADGLKEDLAWGSYVLLRNTNSISVLISAQGALCVRGYWNTPTDLSKESVLDWFEKQIREMGFSNLKDTVSFQQAAADSELKEMAPAETQTFLVEPILDESSRTGESKGFVLLASSMDYAFTDKDRAWIAAIADKF